MSNFETNRVEFFTRISFQIYQECHGLHNYASDEKEHKKVQEMIEKARMKAHVLPDAIIIIELDNSRAGLKIFSDLRHYSPV